MHYKEKNWRCKRQFLLNSDTRRQQETSTD